MFLCQGTLGILKKDENRNSDLAKIPHISIVCLLVADLVSCQHVILALTNGLICTFCSN